jgi:hypothetical protein
MLDVMRTLGRSIMPALLLWFALPARAHAYIDPTAGGLMLQTLIAGAFGLVFWFRDAISAVWKRLTGRRAKG